MRFRSLKWRWIALAIAVWMTAQPASATILSIPFFSQLDPRWFSKTLCNTVSMAMALAYRGAPVDPGKLRAWLNANKGYSNDGEKGPVNYKIACNYMGTHWLDYLGPSTLPDLKTLNQEMGSGKILISESHRFAIHWVIIRGVSADGTKGYYWDPWDTVPTTRLIGDGWVNQGNLVQVFSVPAH